MILTWRTLAVYPPMLRSFVLPLSTERDVLLSWTLFVVLAGVIVTIDGIERALF